jgi:hypothetical protein
MKRISPGMVEAGVNAMALAKRGNPGDDVVVAKVFSAMEHVQAAEETRRAKGETPPVYTHQAWPAWRYGPDGEAEVFDRPEDVPEGWTETNPAAVSNPVRTRRKAA